MNELNEDCKSMFVVKIDRANKFETNSRRKSSNGEEKFSSCVERISVHRNSENGSPRVRWVDENLKLPLALEINEDYRARSNSFSKPDKLKPILRHRATCIVVVSNR
ncbi:hypothetical protein CHS0354_011016 [Potamilus streckersoni]|uniref:Uncharacterized protein n=1 Tax=Potamilus streckersoni TaxID=2493646 RepID=A0AAE0TL30_9BIVA|nr:hypothetical protein CHS0354_011016 [Potamilus streckersoni]